MPLKRIFRNDGLPATLDRFGDAGVEEEIPTGQDQVRTLDQRARRTGVRGSGEEMIIYL